MNWFLVGAVGVAALIALPALVYVGLYAGIRPEASPADKRAVEPTVSIVLPTYNESRIVEAKLDRLCNLDYPMENVEIVVVDSSDDETPELVRDFFADRDRPELTLVEEAERRGLAKALNDAYAAASNEKVVKTDCDSVLRRDTLREAVANLADPEVGAVTGRNVDVLNGSDVEAGYRGIQTYVQMLESHLDSTLIFHGPFSAFDRESVVPIDDDSIADDTELALRIRRNGERAVFDPKIGYKEAAHSSLRERSKNKTRRATGLIRLLVRQRGMLGRYGNYGRLVLPFNWWFMLVSPWLVAAALLLAILGTISVVGVVGVIAVAAVVGFVLAGSRDVLGPLQPAYALFDTQLSLFRAGMWLLRDRESPVWDVDTDLRDAYE